MNFSGSAQEFKTVKELGRIKVMAPHRGVKVRSWSLEFLFSIPVSRFEGDR